MHSSVELPVRIYQSHFVILGCSKTKLSEINEETRVLLVAGAEHDVSFSSSCCKSLILTVQFVLQMAAKGINCVQVFFLPFSSLHSLLIPVTIMDAVGCDISLYF